MAWECLCVCYKVNGMRVVEFCCSAMKCIVFWPQREFSPSHVELLTRKLRHWTQPPPPPQHHPPSPLLQPLPRPLTPSVLTLKKKIQTRNFSKVLVVIFVLIPSSSSLSRDVIIINVRSRILRRVTDLVVARIEQNYYVMWCHYTEQNAVKGNWSITVAASHLCNNLPLHLRHSQLTVLVFCQLPKTYLFYWRERCIVTYF